MGEVKEPRKRDLYDVAIIGGGPSGLAAALAAREEGATVGLFDRNVALGGILNQCIHDGFGLYVFDEVLTGPEFADRYARQVLDSGAAVHSNTLVTEVSPELTLTCSTLGKRWQVSVGAVILGMGCRERTRGMLQIPGERPAGIFTAGTAQYLVNEANVLIGRKAVVLGSGDIGLIMARRLTWEGAEVVAVLEKLPYASGLPRNVRQCLEDYDIPLYLSHTAACVHGSNRLQGITAVKVDEKGNPLAGTEFRIDCDTLLLSVGLIPENELARRAGVALDPCTGGAYVNDRYMTNIPGIFSCGNVLHIHDLADWAASEGSRAGKQAAMFTRGGFKHSPEVSVRGGKGVRYVVPQSVSVDREQVLLSLRVAEPGQDCELCLLDEGRTVYSQRFQRTHPAEMIHVKLRSSEITDCSSLKVCVT